MDKSVIREMPSIAYHEEQLTDDFRLFVLREVVPELNFQGYKHDAKIEVAGHIFHNLICAGLMGRVVADRRESKAMRTLVWDAVIAAGFAVVALGSESSGFTTRYLAQDRLLEKRRLWKLRMLCDVMLFRNTERGEDPTRLGLVVLHSGNLHWITGEPLPEDERKQPVSIEGRVRLTAQRDANDHRKPDPDAVRNGMEYFRHLEDLIERINANNLEHSWVAKGMRAGVGGPREVSFQPNVCLRQVHAGRLFRCVRLYTWGPLGGQGMTKEQRRTLRIDGEPTVELDFSGCHTRMLCHLKGIPGPKGDVYQPEKVFPIFYSYDNVALSRKAAVRNLVKQATNIIWNTSSRSAAAGAVRRALAQAPQEVRGVVYKVERMHAGDLLRRIESAHPDLADKFYCNAAVDLMTADGNVMKHILLEFADAKKPALAVHDSVVVRVSDRAFAEEVMVRTYQKFFRFPPLVHIA